MLRRALLQSCSRHISRSYPYLPFASLRKCSSSSLQVPNSHLAEQLEDGSQTPLSTTISIDRSSLHHLSGHSRKPSTDSELVKHLKSIVKFRGGPISVAEYMEEVLTNPKAGFYISRDVFGAKGDFSNLNVLYPTQYYMYLKYQVIIYSGKDVSSLFSGNL